MHFKWWWWSVTRKKWFYYHIFIPYRSLYLFFIVFITFIDGKRAIRKKNSNGLLYLINCILMYDSIKFQRKINGFTFAIHMLIFRSNSITSINSIQIYWKEKSGATNCVLLFVITDIMLIVGITCVRAFFSFIQFTVQHFTFSFPSYFSIVMFDAHDNITKSSYILITHYVK